MNIVPLQRVKEGVEESVQALQSNIPKPESSF